MIYELLLAGKENAISSRDLAKITGLSRREVSRQIESERRQGLPICATCDQPAPGYYIPADRQEMMDYCSRLLHRQMEIAETLKACKDTARTLPA